MDTLRECLFKQAQRDVALITHKLFEDGLIAVSDEQKGEAKRIIGDIVHGSRRALENKFCKEETSAQLDGRGTGEA